MYYRWLKRWIAMVLHYIFTDICVCVFPRCQTIVAAHTHFNWTKPYNQTMLFLVIAIQSFICFGCCCCYRLCCFSRLQNGLHMYITSCDMFHYWKSVELKVKWNHWNWCLHFYINELCVVYWQFCCVCIHMCARVSIRKIWCNIRKVFLKLTHKNNLLFARADSREKVFI